MSRSQTILGPVTSNSETVGAPVGAAKSTCLSRSGVTVRFPAAMSAKPLATSMNIRSRVAGNITIVSGRLPSRLAYFSLRYRSKSRTKSAVIPRCRPLSLKYKVRL